MSRKRSDIDIDDDEVDDNVTDDDADDDTPSVEPARTRFVLGGNGRRVEVHLSHDGRTVHTDTLELFATPEAAKAAFDAARERLLADGFRKG